MASKDLGEASQPCHCDAGLLHFPVGIEIAIAASVVLLAWWVLHLDKVAFWAWRPRGVRHLFALSLKVIGFFATAIAMTSIIPLLTHAFGVRATETIGVVFLVAEAAIAGLGLLILAGRSGGPGLTDAGRTSLADVLVAIATACQRALYAAAEGGISDRLRSALTKPESRSRLFAALRDLEADDPGPLVGLMTAIANIGQWDTLDHAEQDVVAKEVRGFVLSQEIGRRRLIPKKP